jgi:hypothetical protein
MKYIPLMLFALVVITSCKKETKHAVVSYGCISRIPTSSLSAGDSITVAGLMKTNNLSTNNLAFYEYQTYEALDENNKEGDFQIALAVQLKNGLPVFFYDITFAFEKGILDEPISYIAGNDINTSLDNKPTINLQTLRDSFLTMDKREEANGAVAASLNDSCLVAQFGYYDINIDFPGKGAEYLKAWYVHPKNSNWPQGYFRDDTGGALLFKSITGQVVGLP